MILTLAIEEQETIFSDLGKWVLMMTDAGVSTEVLSFYESMIKKLPSHAQITVLSEKIQGKNLWQLVCEKNPDVTRKLLPLILALPADSVSNLLAFHRKPHRDKTPVTESTKALMTLIEGKTSNREGLQAYHELAFCLDALEKKKVSLHGKLNGLYTAYLRSTDMSVSDFTTKWQTAINESLPQLLQERLPMAKFKDVVTLIAKTFYCLKNSRNP